MIHCFASYKYLCIAKNKQKLGKGCLFSGKKQYSYPVQISLWVCTSCSHHKKLCWVRMSSFHPPSCTNLLLPWSSAGQAHNCGLPSSFHERSGRLVSAVLISSIDFAWTRYKPIQTIYFAELPEWCCATSAFWK